MMSPNHSPAYDVVVVGARCAGAATAMLLARAGHSVLVVDRASLPTDTNSTHSIARGGVVQLATWGLLDRVVASGAPPIRHVTFSGADGVTRRVVKDRAGVDFLLAPRRYVLDDLLLRAAREAGAEALTGSTVTGVLRDDTGRVRGVTLREPDGSLRKVRSRMVVGADGLGSRTASYVGAAVTERHPPSGGTFYTYVGGVDWDGFEFHLAPSALAGVFPTHHGEACVWLSRPAANLRRLLRSGSGKLEVWLDELGTAAPDLAERVRGGTVTAPLRGAVGLPNQLRRASGPGWALVGDAGYHRDPITGHGITDAFRDAELLAGAADLALREPELEAVALASYQTARDVAAAEIFHLTRALGDFPSVPRFLELQSRLSRALEREAQQLAASSFRADAPVPAGV